MRTNTRAWLVTIAQIVGVGIAVLLINNVWIIVAITVGILLWPRTSKADRAEHEPISRS